MKLQPELEETIKRFENIKSDIIPYAEELKTHGKYKDFETRLAWDCLRAVYSITEISLWYKKYDCNDNHITTMIKAALKAIDVI